MHEFRQAKATFVTEGNSTYTHSDVFDDDGFAEKLYMLYLRKMKN
jgi:hypothetical protein